MQSRFAQGGTLSHWKPVAVPKSSVVNALFGATGTMALLCFAIAAALCHRCHVLPSSRHPARWCRDPDRSCCRRHCCHCCCCCRHASAAPATWSPQAAQVGCSPALLRPSSHTLLPRFCHASAPFHVCPLRVLGSSPGGISNDCNEGKRMDVYKNGQDFNRLPAIDREKYTDSRTETETCS